MGVYDFTVLNDQNELVPLEKYAGQVLLIVNTATGCGFTPQYKGLEDLYEKYRDKGFVVLDFPCNQFGGQAPGSIEEINAFCTLKYQTTFPRFQKIEVNGDKEAPLFRYLKEQTGGVFGNAIKWNFTKFLIDRDGTVLERFAPTTKPEQIESNLKALL